MVLAATNRPSEFDEPIMRRLPQAFEIGMPERKERAEILKVTLKGERVEPDMKMETMSSKFHMKMSNAAAFTKLASVDVVSFYHFFVRYLGHCHSWIWRKFLLRRRRRKLQQASIVD
ncbi:unnamed protein product [Brassica napus]|uniref:(rape) hypothetical protein n=1 Tax=Brassica napus TaxID=3708 RepID=A0A816ZVJ4_BRANA|nr:unnamed protein product [Brassica napus]